MAEQDNVKVVQEAYAAFGRADIPGLLELVAEGVDWETPGRPEAIPYAGRRRGRAEVAQFFSTLDEVEEFLRFEPGEFIAQGDRVAVVGSYECRVRQTGRTVALDWLHLFTVRGGRVESFREYLDTAALAAAHQPSAATTGA